MDTIFGSDLIILYAAATVLAACIVVAVGRAGRSAVAETAAGASGPNCFTGEYHLCKASAAGSRAS